MEDGGVIGQHWGNYDAFIAYLSSKPEVIKLLYAELKL